MEEVITQSILKGDLIAFQSAFSKDANPDKCIEGIPILLSAIEAESLDIMRFLLRTGADPDSSNSSGNSALIISSSIGNNLIVQDLLKYGANVDFVNEDGMSSLMAAAKFGHISVVGTLVESGANVAKSDKKGRTALHWATVFNDEDGVFLNLIENGAKIDALDESMLTPVDYATKLKRINILKFCS